MQERLLTSMPTPFLSPLRSTSPLSEPDKSRIISLRLSALDYKEPEICFQPCTRSTRCPAGCSQGRGLQHRSQSPPAMQRESSQGDGSSTTEANCSWYHSTCYDYKNVGLHLDKKSVKRFKSLIPPGDMQRMLAQSSSACPHREHSTHPGK